MPYLSKPCRISSPERVIPLILGLFLICFTSACKREALSGPAAAPPPPTPVSAVPGPVSPGPAPFKNEVYRAIDGSEAVTITSQTELEFRMNRDDFICDYTRQNGSIRVVLTAMGTKEAIYLATIPEGLKHDQLILYDPDHYRPLAQAINRQRRGAAATRELISLDYGKATLQMVTSLLSDGADPNGSAVVFGQVGPPGEPLRKCLQGHGSIEILIALIKAGANVNAIDPGANFLYATPLLTALSSKASKDIISVLLAHGADPNLKHPLATACFNSRLDVLQLFLDRHANANDGGSLANAAYYPDDVDTSIAMMTLLVKYGAVADRGAFDFAALKDNADNRETARRTKFLKSTLPRTEINASGKHQIIFCGVVGKGKKAVFILDNSGSMLDTFDYVRNETISAVNKMIPEDNVNVLLIAETASVLYPACRPATPGVKKDFADQLGKYRAQGNGDAAACKDAFEKAFNMKPDVIYFVTGHHFDKGLIDGIATLNSKQNVQINAIQFFYQQDADCEGRLKELAKNNGGVFKRVGLDDLNK